MNEGTARWCLVAIAAWAIGALLGTWWQTGRFIAREHARFGAAFDGAYATVVQRLDQNEALLDGLVALLRSSRDREFPELRQYANEMLRQPLTLDQALEVFGEWLEHPAARVIEPTGRHASVLSGLLLARGRGGSLGSDAHLAALAIEHGAELGTFDRDFEHFAGLRVALLK